MEFFSQGLLKVLKKAQIKTNYFCKLNLYILIVVKIKNVRLLECKNGYSYNK